MTINSYLDNLGEEEAKVVFATFSQRASIVIDRGYIEEAERYLRQGLEIKEIVGDLGGTAATLSNLGSLQLRRGRVSEALGFFERAAELQERAEDTIGLIRSYLNVATSLGAVGQREKALEFLDRAQRLAPSDSRESEEIDQRIRSIRDALVSASSEA